MLQRPLKLEASPAYIAQIVTEHPQCGALVHQEARLGLLLLLNQDAARKQQRLGPFPGRGETAMQQQEVEPALYWQSDPVVGWKEIVGAPEPGELLVFTIVFTLLSAGPPTLLCPAYW